MFWEEFEMLYVKYLAPGLVPHQFFKKVLSTTTSPERGKEVMI